MDDELVMKLFEILKARKQLLLTGGHGVGKTYYARRVSELLTNGRKEGEWELVSFHPSYQYEDFVQGIAVETVDGGVAYKTNLKVFAEMCEKAKASPSANFVIILDDIGRADMTAIFGELLLAMDHRNYKVTLRDGGAGGLTHLTVPDNVYIIATYNTALKKDMALDYALMRRFKIVDVPNDMYAAGHVGDLKYEHTKTIFDTYFALTEDQRPLYFPGRAYFSTDRIEGTLLTRFKIVPLFREYLKEGILKSEAAGAIDQLEKDNSITLTDRYENIKDFDIPIEINPIAKLNRKSELFENLWDKLLKPILENQLLSNVSIHKCLLFNDRVLLRTNEAGELGTLAAETGPYAASFFRENKPNPVYSYTDDYFLKINDKKYSLFKNFTKDIIPQSVRTKVQKSAENISFVLLKAVTSFYEEYINLLDEYIQQLLQNRWTDSGHNAQQLNKLREHCKHELERFTTEIRNLKTKEEQYDEIVKRIPNLSLIHAKPNDWIEGIDGSKLKITGVYKIMDNNYIDIMEKLGINQMIFYGPPGTSKTFTAKKMIEQLAESPDSTAEEKKKDWQERLEMFRFPDHAEQMEAEAFTHNLYWDIVQFHPSYGYEDFVRGISVKTREQKDNDETKNSIVYETVNRILGRVASAAKKCYEKYRESAPKFFLIIDEINRANMAAVFGELIYALEYRGEQVRTPYEVKGDDSIVIPKNLYLIGTMNSADKSIGGIDYAVRRRFLFVPCLPNEEVIKQNNGENSTAVKLFQCISELFTHYLGDGYYREDVQIGHTYFLTGGDDTELRYRFMYQIVPILHEYYKDGVLVDKDASSEDHLIEVMEVIRRPPLSEDAGNLFDKLVQRFAQS